MVAVGGVVVIGRWYTMGHHREEVSGAGRSRLDTREEKGKTDSTNLT